MSEKRLSRKQASFKQRPAASVLMGSDGANIYENGRTKVVPGLVRTEATGSTYYGPVCKITGSTREDFSTEDLPFGIFKRTVGPISDISRAIEWSDGERKCYQ